jgi:outer membrane protein assembly factor BamB
MKYNNLILITLLMINIQQSCKVRENISSPSANNGIASFDTIWSHKVDGFSATPVLNSDGDVLGSKVFTEGKGEVFKLLDGKTGELKWEWHDYFSPEEIFYGESNFFFNDIMVLSNSNTTYAFDSKSGKTIWRDRQENKIGESYIVGDEDGFVYHAFRDKEVGNKTVRVYRTMYNSFGWEEVFVFTDSTDNVRLFASNMAVGKNEFGEKILTLTLSFLKNVNGGNKEQSKVFAVNLKTKKIIWQLNYNLEQINNTYWRSKMKVYKNKIFIFSVAGANYYLESYNLSTGKIEWIKPINNFGIDLQFYNDFVISIVNGNNSVCAFNIYSGGKVWEQFFPGKTISQISFGSNDSKVFKNYLLSTQCNYFLGLNLNNGEISFFDKPIGSVNCMEHGLAINEEKRWFYIQDRRYINCYTLPFQIK